MSHEVGAPDDGASGGDLRAGSSLTSPASDGPTSTPSTELTATLKRPEEHPPCLATAAYTSLPSIPPSSIFLFLSMVPW